MQSLDISSHTDDGLQILANKIPEMKHISNFDINSMLTKLKGHTHIVYGPQ